MFGHEIVAKCTTLGIAQNVLKVYTVLQNKIKCNI